MTQNKRCHAAYSTSQAHPGFRPIPQASAVSSLVPIPSPTSRINPDEASSDDAYRLVGHDDIQDPFNGGVDPADVTDAEALEALTQGVNASPSYLPRQETSVVQPSPAILEDHGPPPAHIEGGNSGEKVIIDHFPFGSPGAPIAGQHENVTPNGTSPEDSIVWAPFRSQRDWEIAHWAKTRGPTSTAVGDLLAIPEVCASGFFFHLIMTLICIEKGRR
jgi:hypothetical protein